jgi:type I restriction enzyme S subunit
VKDEIRRMKAEWKTLALNQVASLNPRLPISLLGDDQVSFVPMSAVSADKSDVTEKETRSYEEVSKGYTPFVSGDVLVAKITPCFENGKIALARLQQKAGFGSTEFHVIRALPGKLDPRYLVHFMRQPWIRVAGERRMTGSGGQRRVPENFLAKVEIPLPPLAEQRQIAEVLDRAEALRAKRRAALAELDALTQSIFLDLFGDPVTNPKGWPHVNFEDICERVTVGIVVKPSSYYVPKGVPALRSLNIKPGRIVLQDLVFFSESDNDTKLTKTKLKVGDLVLVRSGQPGTAAVVPTELDGVNAIDLLIATPLSKLTDATFLCEFFNSSGGRDLVLSKQRGQVQKHLNVGSLNEAAIPLPPLALQQEFARRVAAVEKLKQAQRTALTELDALFATLQHRAFRGEL